MKNIARIAAICILLAICLSGCKKKDGVSVVGCWQLESIETRASIGDVEVDVYLRFAADKTFEIHQMLGEGRYRHFTGTYTLTGKVLDGTYEDGTKWGSSYEVANGKGTLTLTSLVGSPDQVGGDAVIPGSDQVGGGAVIPGSDRESPAEITTYISIPEIPAEALQ